MSTRLTDYDVCYLCGLKLVEPIDWDHVPLKQLYAPEVRKAYNPKLLTIPVHAACNKGFQKDEDYFVHALMPFARGSYAGNAIYQKTLHTFRQGRNPGLVRKVLREFEPRPSGLVLPGNKVVKRFNGARISRVAWKIVRGLYFDHHNEVLRAKAARWVSLTPPNQVPPEHFRVFVNLPENPSRGHGEYPGVFDYKFQKYPEGHYWALLFWDRIIMTVLFHDSSCSCDKANWILRSSVLQTLEWVLRKPVSKKGQFPSAPVGSRVRIAFIGTPVASGNSRKQTRACWQDVAPKGGNVGGEIGAIEGEAIGQIVGGQIGGGSIQFSQSGCICPLTQ